MDFSSSRLIPSWNCWCLTHNSSLSQAVSHLTSSDRILCATFKSLPGLEPLEAHPSWRLAVTALLVPTGTAWECCKGMQTGCNWSEVRACSCDLHAGGQGKRAAVSIPTALCLLLPLPFCPLCWDIRGSFLLSVVAYWDVMDMSTQDRKTLAGKVEF